MKSQKCVCFFFMSLAGSSALPKVPGGSPRAEVGGQLSTSTFEYSPLSFNQSLAEMTSAQDLADDVFLPWDNPYNVITRQDFLLFEKISFCYVSLGLFLIGVPCNVINCVVFYRQGLRERMNLCLFCLALVDLLYVFFWYVVASSCVVGYVYPEVEQWWKLFTRKYFTGIYRGFLYSSGCLTALIALERCVCVVLPLKAASLIRTRTIGVLIVLIVGLIQLAAVVYPLHLDIGSRTDPETGRTTLYLTSSEFYGRHELLYTVVEDTILMVVVPFLTFIIVVVSTVVTVLELKLRLRWRQLSSSSDEAAARQQVKLVSMLVVVSCLYIVTAAPNVALGLTRTLLPEFRHTRRYANIFLFSHMLYLMLALLNSSVNFFVYVIRSSRFRAHLAAMLGCQAATRSGSNDVSGAHSGSAIAQGSVLRVSRVPRFWRALGDVLCCGKTSASEAGPASGNKLMDPAMTMSKVSESVVDCGCSKESKKI